MIKSFSYLALFIAVITATTTLAQQSNSQSHMYTKKDKDGFVYQSDTRPFSQRPQNPIAKEKKWSDRVDKMVLVQPKKSTMWPFYIDAFEALVSNNRAWSVPGYVPTDRLMFSEAEAMCQNAGKRLCSTEEWQTACRGGHTKPVKFNQISQMAKACDFARAKPYSKDDFIQKTDSHPQCTAPSLPLYHMIGNMAEFTKSASGKIEVVGLTYYDTHMTDKAYALSIACEVIAHPNGRYPAKQYNKGTGFRCCKNAK
ncbi:MAG: SUMF1/EgtB/PvdO family nonheme iron enzyme [Bdellovibrionales bacterium]